MESAAQNEAVRHNGVASGARKLAFGALIIGGIPTALLLLSFVFVRSPYFMKNCDYNWISSQSQLYAARNVSCDILIFGDSSAMVGIDPRIVAEKTHMTACNISTTTSAMTVLGTQSLDYFLARNPHRPRYLVFQYMQRSMYSDFSDTYGNSSTFALEALVPMLRYGYANMALHKMLASPDSFIALMYYVYMKGGLNLVKHFASGYTSNPEAGAGSYTVRHERPLLGCPELHVAPIEPRNVAWLQDLRRHYSSSAQNVIINTAPTADCNPYYQQWNSALSGSIDVPVRIYPVQDFMDVDYHLTREGAVRLSEDTANQILTYHAK